MSPLTTFSSPLRHELLQSLDIERSLHHHDLAFTDTVSIELMYSYSITSMLISFKSDVTWTVYGIQPVGRLMEDEDRGVSLVCMFRRR